MEQQKAESSKFKAQIGFIISSFVYLFISSLLVHASVVLNEVAIQPNQAVELYNSATTSADISGWYIDDVGGSTYYTIAPQTILAPLSCYVFTADFNFNKASSDVVRLFDNSYPPTTSSAKIIESYSYTKAPDTDYSFVKIIDGGGEWQTSISSLGLFNETLTSCVPTATPTPIPTDAPTQTPTATPTSTPYPQQPIAPPTDYSNIFISEVFPYPAANEHEWVELYNNNDFQVALDNWYVDDGENTGSAPKLFTLLIEPYSYKAVDFASSLFNNSGDTARLLNADKAEKDSMEYGKVTQEKSIGRTSFENDEYCEQKPSKNAPNVACATQTTPITERVISTISKPTPTKKATSSIKKQVLARTQKVPIKATSLRPKITHVNGDILGMQVKKNRNSSPILYSSLVSFSYSLLTIVSIFIKMKNA